MNAAAIKALPVMLFLKAHEPRLEQIIINLNATDDLLRGHQEERFFRGHCDCYYYLPLYVFCCRHY